MTGEWQRIDEYTEVLQVPGGCVLKATWHAPALCFIPYRNEVLGKAMERWIEQATERQKGEGK